MYKKPETIPQNVKSQFAQWAKTFRGNQNPQDLTNDVWVWLWETETFPYMAHKLLGSGEQIHPGWAIDRYGQSTTEVPNGTEIYIAGEHEDHYDADFYIYNDVIVKTPDGSIKIFGYPVEVFPPTDSHSATLVGHEIFIIGRIGYPHQHLNNQTLVHILNTNDFSIKHFPTYGVQPNWLYDHVAHLSTDGQSIICSGGTVTAQENDHPIDNLTEWKLDLTTGDWHALSVKNWTRWILLRASEEYNELFEIRSLERKNHYKNNSRKSEFLVKCKQKFEERGHSPDFEIYRNRYVPNVEHKKLAKRDGDKYCTHRIEIDGVCIKYVESRYDITVTIEGKLPDQTIALLKAHGIKTFEALEGVPYKIIELT